MKIRIITYARVSSDKQAKEDTIARQRSVNLQTLERLKMSEPDLQVVGHFEDEGFNAESVDPKTDFWSQVIPLVQSKSITHIIVTSWDRIFRGKSSELRGKIEDAFRSSKITLVADNSLTVFSGDDTQARLTTSLLTNLGAINKLESVKIMHSGRRRKLQEEGEWFLSIVPFGFRLERELDGKKKRYRYPHVPEEAEIVRQIFEKYAGEGLGAVRLAEWAEATFPGSRLNYRDRNPNARINEKWDKQSIIRMLRNTMYAGELFVRFEPTEKVAGFSDQALEKVILVDPIIPKDLFLRAQKRLEAVREKLVDDRTPRKPDNWLHGLIECRECGQRLVGRLQKFRWYGCPGLHGTIFRADDLEERVAAILHEYVLDTANFQKTLDKAAAHTPPAEKEIESLERDLAKAEKEVGGIQGQLDNLTKALVKGLLDEEQYARTRAEILQDRKAVEDRLTVIQARLESLSRSKKETPAEKYRKVLPKIAKMSFSPQEYREILTGLEGKVVTKQVVRTADLEKDSGLLEELYLQGYIVLKDFRDVGRSPKWVYSRFGKNGRKVAVDWRPVIVFPWTEIRGWLPDGVEEVGLEKRED